jgi:dethiobiotin synthetase
MTSRPARLVVVVGTATEVGKTWATGAVAAAARNAGHRVAARKPVQSFAADDDNATDAELLAGVTGEAPTDVCPPHRWYPLAMAPPMAADALGRERIAVDDLVGELQWPADVTMGLLETIGGVRSPLAHDADSLGLAGRLRPDRAVLVADAELGAINATQLSLAALTALEPTPLAVFVNRYDADNDLHRRNLDWLRAHTLCALMISPLEVADWISRH